MRLIQVNTPGLDLKEFNENDVPPYAILSHVWEDQEVTYNDLPLYSNQAVAKSGIIKVLRLCEKAREKGYEYAWIDTCCIDKSSTTELSEAINSMYRWYAKAAVCFAYLSDCEDLTLSFERSKWFTRGWTLQELIAPPHLEFYNKDWTFLSTRTDLRAQISAITSIQEEALTGERPQSFSIAQRMSWAAGRKTTRVEDRAYSLLGLFGVTLPLLYGAPDSRNAFVLLQEEIIKHSDDHTIFAWDHGFPEDGRGHCGLLAHSPDAFTGCSDIVRSLPSNLNEDGFGFTNAGLTINVLTKPFYHANTHIAMLECSSGDPEQRYAILIEGLEGTRQYARVKVRDTARLIVSSAGEGFSAHKIRVRQQPGRLKPGRRGFWIRNLEFPDRDDQKWTDQVKTKSQYTAHKTATEGFIVAAPPSARPLECVLVLPRRKYQLRPSGRVNRNQISELRLGFDQDMKPTCSVRLEKTFRPWGERCWESLRWDSRCWDSVSHWKKCQHDQHEEASRPVSDVQQSLETRCEWSHGAGHSWKIIERYRKTEIGSITAELVQCPPRHEEKDTTLDEADTIWTITMKETEELFPPTHRDEVMFKLEEPCQPPWIPRGKKFSDYMVPIIFVLTTAVIYVLLAWFLGRNLFGINQPLGQVVNLPTMPRQIETTRTDVVNDWMNSHRIGWHFGQGWR